MSAEHRERAEAALVSADAAFAAFDNKRADTSTNLAIAHALVAIAESLDTLAMGREPKVSVPE
ncbi:MAG TPA: hypothetical protein VF625_17475 [Longimicrobium sp.]|jgi:hypothetical protein